MLQDRLADDLRKAMKSGDKVRVEVLRMVRAGLQYAEIAKGKPLDEPEVLGVISKQVKQRRESIAEFQKGRRPDLVQKEEAELKIILEYLPQQMSREEIASAARQVIDEVGARGPGDKGRVMQKLMPQLKGRAEGREINELVTELLGGS